MKKIVFLILAASIGIGAAAQDKQSAQTCEKKNAAANDGKPMKRHQMNERQRPMNAFFNDALNLTDEQKAQLKELQTAFAKENRQASNLINEKKARLKTLQDEDVVNLKEVNKTIDEMTSLHAKQMKAQAAHRVKVRAILTPEQRETFSKMNERAAFKNNARLNNAPPNWQGKGQGHRGVKAQ